MEAILVDGVVQKASRYLHRGWAGLFLLQGSYFSIKKIKN